MNKFSELLQTVCVFSPEIYGVWSICVLIIFGISTKQYWSQAGYTELIFFVTIIGLMGITVLLYTSELSWYFSAVSGHYEYYGSNLDIVRYHSSYLTAIVRISIVLLTLIRIYYY